MITVELTTYGQSVASNRVTIEGIVLLSDQISDVSSVTNIPSSTLLDIEACGSVTTNNIGNVIISDSSSSMWSAKTILFYVTTNNVKKVVAGYSQSAHIIKKSATSLNVAVPFNFSAFTYGFCFSVIKSCSTVATHDSDGVLHIDNPDISADDDYAVYSKSQVDELLQGVSTSLSSGNIIPSDNNTYDIGSSAYKWKNAYFTGGNSSHYTTIDNNGGEPTIRPDASNYGYLGTTSYKWYKGYINNLYCNSLSIGSKDLSSVIASTLIGDTTSNTGIGSIRQVEIYVYNSDGDTSLYIKSGTTLSGYDIHRVYSRTYLTSVNFDDGINDTFNGTWALLDDVWMGSNDSHNIVTLAIRIA